MISDADLVARYRAEKSSEVFAQIVERHGAMVVRACFRVLLSMPDAEDAAQATFLALAAHPESVQGPLGAWLYVVAQRTAGKMVRERQRRVRREVEAARRRPEAASLPEADTWREEIDSALVELPDKLREAVVLCYLESRKQEEAAALAGCPAGTLGRRSAEGIQKLRTVLARRGLVLSVATLTGLLLGEGGAAAAVTPVVASLKLWAAGLVIPQAAAGKTAAGASTAAWIKGTWWAVAAATVAIGTSLPFVLPSKPTPTSPVVLVSSVASVPGHTGGIWAMTLSPDGRALAIATGSQLVRFRDAATGADQGSLKAHDKEVRAVAYSPDGQWLATAGGDDERTVKLWDLASRQEIFSRLAHGEGVPCLAFSPDGQTLASASWDGTIILWDVPAGRRRLTLTGHESGVGIVRFLAAGKQLLSGSNDATLKLWDTGSGKVIKTLTGHTEPVQVLTVSADEQTIYTGGYDRTIRIWELATGKTKQVIDGLPTKVQSLGLGPDGRSLVAGFWSGQVCWYEIATGKVLATLPNAHGNQVTSLVVSGDGTMLASGSYDQTLRLWGPRRD